MKALDAAILAALRSVLANVHDGEAPADDTGKVVTSPLPYVVYYSDIGFDGARRQSGDAGQREVSPQVTYVGGSRDQAKWAGQRARAVLADQWLTVAGEKVQLRATDSMRVRRDDDVRRPDGGSLFYGVDQYAVTTLIPH